MHSGALCLAHRWTLLRHPGLPHTLVREFIRPAVRAVPASMARRLGHCRISLEIADPTVSSQWTETEAGLEVSVITAESEDTQLISAVSCPVNVRVGRIVRVPSAPAFPHSLEKAC